MCSICEIDSQGEFAVWLRNKGALYWPRGLGWGGRFEGSSKASILRHSAFFTVQLSHPYDQMINIEILLIIFFAAKDGEALYSQQKQDWELTVAQIMNSLLPNSGLN